MKARHWTLTFVVVSLLISVMLYGVQKYNHYNTDHVATVEEPLTGFVDYKIGDKVDSFNGVYVYYNGITTHKKGRRVTADGYNLGLEYQCVEFVKRYYYEFFNHKMPNSYGDAKDFFNADLKDGEFNADRALIQYTNPSSIQPQVNDILILSPSSSNQYGHIAIVSSVSADRIEIVQQNPGAYHPSRERFELLHSNDIWKVNHSRVLGWLRKE